ncbi:glycosyltransferase [Hydrogenimonas sp. SS33]|uniref:glycosyltransferase n=1 Tax=Hydrogenimonas leucolamina TaxID=2954236 RepID=UPI00336BBE5E
MKYLIHAVSTNMGGAKRHLDSMMAELSESAPEDEFFVVLNERYHAEWDRPNIRIIRYPIKYSNGLRRLWFDNVEINRLIKEFDIDLLLSFANFGPFKAKCRHLLFETNALYFCDNIRHLYPLKSRVVSDLRKQLIKLSGTGADLILTPSESLKNQLIDAFGFDEKKITVLPHAMDRKSLGAPNAEEKKSGDTVRFIVTSHLTRHKRVETMLKALVLLKEDEAIGCPFHVRCTFDRRDNAAYYDELKAYIDKHKLNDLVSFIGRVDQAEMGNLYASADCMLHTTACESFGFALLEAKLFRLPAICSDIAVNREIAKNSALYFRTDDPADLAEKMKQFILERPENFDFDDGLVNWNWKRYSDRLLQIAGRMMHG